MIVNGLNKTIVDGSFHINEVLSVETFSYPTIRTVVTLQYDYDILLYHKNDTSVYTFGEKKYTAKEGDIVFIPRNTRYTRRLVQERVDIICVDFLLDLPEDISLSPQIFHNIPNADSLFKKLYKTWSVRIPGFDLGALGCLYSANMLITTNLSITDLCYECGFENASWFYSSFKKKYVLTPKEFRKKHKPKL